MNSKDQLTNLKGTLIDPKANHLISKVKWIKLNGLNKHDADFYPIVIDGEGDVLLLIHGFDSCFLEFRRLAPLLREKYKLIIPDLYGFGFCPRPNDNDFGFEILMKHLNIVVEQICGDLPIGVIGASMGGALAMELARQQTKKVQKLLLLSPAGLTGKTSPIPWPANHIGACFLHQSFVRKALCRQAFANPKENVGQAEEQIASIHLNVPGWHRSLAAFARSGGVSNCAEPIPPQPTKILIGEKDKIIPRKEKEETEKLLKNQLEIIPNCGHLPHLERPKEVVNHLDKLM